ncbi:MAG: hypothetical protein V4820_11900 [Pseudomonadota bacterium]
MRQLTAEQRQRLAAAQAEIAEIMDPQKAAERKARRERDREMRKRVGKRSEGQRQPRERDPGFLAFLRRLPCIAGEIEGGCSGPIQAAHIRYTRHGQGRNPGMGSKNHDRHATSLCERHHLHDQHTRSEVAFWAGLGVDAYDYAAELYAAYQAGEDGLAVVRRFSPNKARTA